MRDQIRAMVDILYDLDKSIKSERDPAKLKELKAERKLSKKRIEQMYAISEEMLDLKYQTPQHENIVIPHDPLPLTDDDVYAGEHEPANPVP